MNSMLALAPLAFGFIAVAAAFILTYRLRELEDSLNRADWEKGRRVEGIVWQMPDPMEEAEARKYRMLEWIFATPEWARKDQRATRLLFWLRVCFVAANLAGLVFMFLVLVSR